MTDELRARRAGMIDRLRASIATIAVRRARRLSARPPTTAIPWLKLAALFAPRFGAAHRGLIGARRESGDPLGAIAEAERWTGRFPDDPSAWVAMGDAYEGAYRTREALRAYEEALAIEERADAAMAAGYLYRRLGDQSTAGARFARAYAAGAGPEALRENARSLLATGDQAAAAEAIRMWEKETGLRWTDETHGAGRAAHDA